MFPLGGLHNLTRPGLRNEVGQSISKDDIVLIDWTLREGDFNNVEISSEVCKVIWMKMRYFAKKLDIKSKLYWKMSFRTRTNPVSKVLNHIFKSA